MASTGQDGGAPRHGTAADRALLHAGRTAIADRDGERSYADLHAAAGRVAAGLLAGRPDLEEARVALLAEPGFGWAAVQWGIYRAGGIAVPLALSHPAAELEH